MNEVQALVGRRTSVEGSRAGSALLTNFYPLYGGANDQVDPVLRVQPVLFQRVIPRYRLSTSETRDQGLGPMFADIPESPFARSPGELRRVGTDSSPERLRQEGRSEQPGAAAVPGTVLEPWLGRRVDLFA